MNALFLQTERRLQVLYKYTYIYLLEKCLNNRSTLSKINYESISEMSMFEILTFLIGKTFEFSTNIVNKLVVLNVQFDGNRRITFCISIEVSELICSHLINTRPF